MYVKEDNGSQTSFPKLGFMSVASDFDTCHTIKQL